MHRPTPTKRQLEALRAAFEVDNPYMRLRVSRHDGIARWSHGGRSNAVRRMLDDLTDRGLLTRYNRDYEPRPGVLTSKGLEALIQRYAQRDEFDELQARAKAALVDRQRFEAEMEAKRKADLAVTRRRADEQREQDRKRTRDRVRQVLIVFDMWTHKHGSAKSALMLSDDELDRIIESMGDAINL